MALVLELIVQGIFIQVVSVFSLQQSSVDTLALSVRRVAVTSSCL